MKRLGLSIFLIGIVVFTSCKKGVFCYREDDEIVKQERTLKAFDKIELDLAANVIIEQGENQLVEVESSNKLIEIIETTVNGSTLEIKSKKNKCIAGDPVMNVNITVPVMKRITVSGSGDVVYNHEGITDLLELEIRGSGDINCHHLKANQVLTTIDGSGEITLQGEDVIPTMKSTISGSGNLSAYELPVSEMDITIGGSGNAYVQVLDMLNAKITGSGNVIYKGTPTVISSETGSGEVRAF